MPPTITRPDHVSEARERLVEQARNLGDACAAFDRGRTAQFLSMAAILRLLFGQQSLARQARLDGLRLPSSTLRQAHQLHGGSSDLIMLGRAEKGFEAMALLRPFGPESRWLKVKHWWPETVCVDSASRPHSRGSLVLAVANKDGGVHFDSGLDEAYALLAREGAFGAFSGGSGAWKQINPVPAILRQIAHEVLIGLGRACEHELGYSVPTRPVGLAIVPGFEIITTAGPGHGR